MMKKDTFVVIAIPHFAGVVTPKREHFGSIEYFFSGLL
jgi:hypothetical protein